MTSTEDVAKSVSDETLIEKKDVSLRATNLRWFALSLACFTSIGSYYCFDNPQALQSYIQTNFNIDNTDFAWLYTVYSLPNIVLPLFGGLIIDRLGVRVAIVTFAFLLIIGQGIFTYGAYLGPDNSNAYGVMIAGRVVFGLGGESLSVAQSSVTAKWFMGRELAFSMGLTLCVARLGSSLNSVLSPKIYVWSGGDLYVPLLVGFFITIFSWCCGFSLTVIDRRADKQEGEVAVETDQVSCKDFTQFKKIYYLLLFNCFFLYGAFFGIMDNINDLLSTRFGFDPTAAGNYITIVYICSAIITPIFGFFIDKKGRRVTLMIMASIIFTITHIFIAFLNDGQQGSPQYWIILGLLGIGLFYSVYASIFWPCVPLVVEPRVVGSAYGLITALQNLMLATIPLVTGVIHDNTVSFHDGYFWTEITLAGLVIIGIGVTTWMYFEDKASGGRLEQPGALKNKARTSQATSFHKQ